MSRPLASWIATLLVVFLASPSGAAPPADAERLFANEDPRISEASGIAAGIRNPDVFFVHNDSSDGPRFFALDARTGKTRAEYTVPAADNVDWEDIAVTRDADGRAVIWLADIGDNDRVREEAVLYRVREPRVATVSTPQEVAVVDTWRLRYPGGPRDGEALLVHPAGRVFIGTRSTVGATEVFEVPVDATDDGTRLLREVARVNIRLLAGPRPSDLALMVSGGAIAQDGGVIVLRTYTHAYLWPLRNGDVESAFDAEPVRVQLPLQPQGEGVTVVGDRMVVNSEFVGSPVFAVPLPAALRGTPASTPSARGTEAPPLTPVRENPGWGGVVAAAVLAALAAGALVILWRARRSPPEP